MSAEPQLGGRLCICVGAGGVGKTTVAAAIACSRARQGQRVAVVTIDPAPRLAQALGFDELSSEPRRVQTAGELWAMRLDPKRTLDDLIASLAADEGVRERALSNRIYRELSGAVAGSQEFSAVAKLYELDRNGDFDSIVLDTPPSRNALDFLDAPARLMRFFDGRTLRLLISQGGLASRVASRASAPLLGVLGRLTGTGVLREITAFFVAIGGMVEGLAARAAAVEALLRDPASTFVVVSSPRAAVVEETIAFAAQLREAELTLAALVVNRVHEAGAPAPPAGVLEALVGERLAALVGESVHERDARAAADAAGLARLRDAFEGLETVVIPELAGELEDLAALDRLAFYLERRPGASTVGSPSVAQ
ncbi:MAG TPA: ArsA family ATPase [Solirubrobacteraceae bacterium]|nr:ArsA family ATPase [Solirubrobacteraceae bacterium]